ncbi:MAG: phosphoribosylformylglycinamidine cyclo-ligase [Candidatus Bilamarchaeaceae archaeon]
MKYQIDISHVRKIQDSIWDSIKSTFAFRKGFGEPLPVFGHYGGLFKCGNETLVIHTDGVGTKVLVAQALEKYDTIGVDAIAMSVNDILCVGAEPLVGVDYLALAREDDELVAEIMKGLAKGAEESGCAIVGGETAIMPDIITGGAKPFDLAFTVVGRVKKQIIGEDIVKGDVIVGLESSGLHSNGYTLARRLLDIKKWGEEMLKPTRIYARAVIEMIDVCDIHGIAHITGGAFSKITRLNQNLGYDIEIQKPSGIFEELSKKIELDEMCRTFNMGVGMIVILPEDRAHTIINIAKKCDINADIIGKVVEEKGVRVSCGDRVVKVV